MYKKLKFNLHRNKYKIKQAEIENNMVFYNARDNVLSALMNGDAQGYQEYVGVASCLVVDADMDLIIPKGIVLDRYLDNPVLVDGHDVEKRVIGSVKKIGVNDTHVLIYFVFNENNERAIEIKKDVDNGFVNMFSVGFQLLDQKRITSEDENNTYTFDYENGNVTIDLSTFTKKPNKIINKWELLENSIVTVGSNPQALVIRKEAKLFKEKAEKIKDKYKDDIKYSFVKSIVDSALENIENAHEAYEKTLENIEIKTVVAEHSTPVNLEKSFSGSDSRDKAAIWASSDASGDKDKIDWSKFALVFGQFDSEKLDNFTSYKFPHHDIINGELVAVWKGIVNAVARLKNSNIPEEDKRGVYDHLAKHAEDAGKELIAYENLKSLSDLELKEYEETGIVKKEVEPEIVEEIQENVEKAVETKDINEIINKKFDSVTKQINDIKVELTDTVKSVVAENIQLLKIKLEVLRELIDEKMVQVEVEKEIEKEIEQKTEDMQKQVELDSKQEILEKFASLADLFKIENK